MGLDNQQERLAFLGGLIEGEGTITIQRSNKRANGKQNIYPLVQIANSNRVLVEAVVEMLRDLGVSPYVYWKSHERYADSATIHMGGYQRVGRLLRLVTPYLISKRPHAEIVLAMCDRRCDLAKNTPYSDADHAAVAEIRILNTKPSTRLRESSETVREAHAIVV